MLKFVLEFLSLSKNKELVAILKIMNLDLIPENGLAGYRIFFPLYCYLKESLQYSLPHNQTSVIKTMKLAPARR